MSSIAGIRWVGASSISYASSKAAVIQFTQTVALEFARKRPPRQRDHPRCRQDARPGELDQSDRKDDPQKMWRYLDEKSPCGRIGDAWDAAHAALFLASDEAR
jgi:NAD(P)-dependent dehydrogenase (short-subunit alcohol dehydrogenase family)